MPPSARARGVRVRPWIVLAALVAISLSTREVFAYPWMLRHGYTACATCHTDPSGAGLLEPYGSLIANELLRTQYSPTVDEDSNAGAFLGGVFELPEELRLKGDVRYLALANKVEDRPIDTRTIWMQVDFAAGVRVKNFVASASVGYAPEGAGTAALTRDAKDNLVSRQHWLGFWTDSRELLVRAGRMNVPFGIRTVEHTLWVRSLSQTTINDDQQHGAAAYYGNELLRAELMAILGNFQERPDDYRERGYSGYVEFNVLPELSLGASSLITHKELDDATLEKTWRHAHGIMGRWATPWKPLALLTEVDYLLYSSQDTMHRKGFVGYLQADIELLQGIHVLTTAETQNVGLDGTPYSFGGWLSYQWFFAPHADLRLDNVYYRLRNPSQTTEAFEMLAQLHLYL